MAQPSVTAMRRRFSRMVHACRQRGVVVLVLGTITSPLAASRISDCFRLVRLWDVAFERHPRLRLFSRRTLLGVNRDTRGCGFASVASDFSRLGIARSNTVLGHLPEVVFTVIEICRARGRAQTITPIIPRREFPKQSLPLYRCLWRCLDRFRPDPNRGSRAAGSAESCRKKSIG